MLTLFSANEAQTQTNCLSPSFRNTKTFWMSTGMFPQEFIIRFAEPTKISAVTVDSCNGTEAVMVSYVVLNCQRNCLRNQAKTY